MKKQFEEDRVTERSRILSRLCRRELVSLEVMISLYMVFRCDIGNVIELIEED